MFLFFSCVVITNIGNNILFKSPKFITINIINLFTVIMLIYANNYILQNKVFASVDLFLSFLLSTQRILMQFIPEGLRIK